MYTWLETKRTFDTYEDAEKWLADFIAHDHNVSDYYIEKRRTKYHLAVEVEIPQ